MTVFSFKNLAIYSILLVFTTFFITNMHLLTENSYMFLPLDKFNPYFDYSLGILWFIIFTLIVIKTLPKEYLFIWLIKVFVTLVIMLFYEWHYRLDAFLYFSTVIDIDNPYVSKHGGGTMLMVYFNYYLSYIIGESYQALKLLHSLIGFLGLVLFYKSFELVVKESNISISPLYIYFFFLFPTILFWSSILGKDPLNLFILGVAFYSIFNMIKRFHYSYLLLLVIVAIGLYFLRYWFLLIFAIAIVLYFTYFYLFRKNWYLFFGVVFISIVVLISLEQNKYTLSVLNILNYLSSSFAHGNSATETYVYESFGDYFLYLIPNMFTTLFRPTIFDATNPFMFVSACENIILLLLCIKFVLFRLKDLVQNKYILFVLFYIFAWLVFYAMVSPGNLGTAARFKLQVLPALLIVIGYSIHLNYKKEAV